MYYKYDDSDFFWRRSSIEPASVLMFSLLKKPQKARRGRQGGRGSRLPAPLEWRRLTRLHTSCCGPMSCSENSGSRSDLSACTRGNQMQRKEKQPPPRKCLQRSNQEGQSGSTIQSQLPFIRSMHVRKANKAINNPSSHKN
jgi:hypothetical protein